VTTGDVRRILEDLDTSWAGGPAVEQAEVVTSPAPMTEKPPVLEPGATNGAQLVDLDAAAAGAAGGARDRVAAFALVEAGIEPPDELSPWLIDEAAGAAIDESPPVAFGQLGSRVNGYTLPSVQPPPGARSETAELDGAWDPVDVDAVLADDPNARVEACILRRSDGVGLLYAGQVNGLVGEPESLKSWLALVACVQELEAEHHVVYVDLEDNARSVILKRLHRDLGVDAARLRTFFHYIRPEEPITKGDTRTRLLAAAAAWSPSLAVVDGVTEALALHGLSSVSDVDIASLAALLTRPLADLGAAVLPVDHVVKDPEQRGRWATGSQHKLSAVGGAAYGIHVVRVARRGAQDGLSRVVVTKDRQGAVRPHATAGGTVADLHFGSSQDGVVSWRLEPPEAGKDAAAFRPTHLMERVSGWLEGQVAERSQNEIVASVTGKERAILAAIRCLVDDGFVVTNTGPRGAKLHRSARPFREAGDD
jgi:hypothetical protein